jgi:hypothetical protein
MGIDMVEVRHIAPSEDPPADENCILIDRIGARFRACGWIGGKVEATFLYFNSEREAIKATSSWAARHAASIVYVRASPDVRRP